MAPPEPTPARRTSNKFGSAFAAFEQKASVPSAFAHTLKDTDRLGRRKFAPKNKFIRPDVKVSSRNSDLEGLSDVISKVKKEDVAVQRGAVRKFQVTKQISKRFNQQDIDDSRPDEPGSATPSDRPDSVSPSPKADWRQNRIDSFRKRAERDTRQRLDRESKPATANKFHRKTHAGTYGSSVARSKHRNAKESKPKTSAKSILRMIDDAIVEGPSQEAVELAAAKKAIHNAAVAAPDLTVDSLKSSVRSKTNRDTHHDNHNDSHANKNDDNSNSTDTSPSAVPAVSAIDTKQSDCKTVAPKPTTDNVVGDSLVQQDTAPRNMTGKAKTRTRTSPVPKNKTKITKRKSKSSAGDSSHETTNGTSARLQDQSTKPTTVQSTVPSAYSSTTAPDSQKPTLRSTSANKSTNNAYQPSWMNTRLKSTPKAVLDTAVDDSAQRKSAATATVTTSTITSPSTNKSATVTDQPSPVSVPSTSVPDTTSANETAIPSDVVDDNAATSDTPSDKAEPIIQPDPQKDGDDETTSEASQSQGKEEADGDRDSEDGDGDGDDDKDSENDRANSTSKSANESSSKLSRSVARTISTDTRDVPLTEVSKTPASGLSIANNDTTVGQNKSAAVPETKAVPTPTQSTQPTSFGFSYNPKILDDSSDFSDSSDDSDEESDEGGMKSFKTSFKSKKTKVSKAADEKVGPPPSLDVDLEFMPSTTSTLSEFVTDIQYSDDEDDRSDDEQDAGTVSKVGRLRKAIDRAGRRIEYCQANMKEQLALLKKEEAKERNRLEKDVQKRIQEQRSFNEKQMKKDQKAVHKGKEEMEKLQADNKRLRGILQRLPAQMAETKAEIEAHKTAIEDIEGHIKTLEKVTRDLQAKHDGYAESKRLCQEEYLPKYRQELYERQQYIDTETKVKQLYQSVIYKIARAVDRTRQPSLIESVTDFITEAEREVNPRFDPKVVLATYNEASDDESDSSDSSSDYSSSDSDSDSDSD